MRHSYSRASMIESLEGRTLLSVAPLSAGVDHSAVHAATVVPHLASQSTKLTGSYKGSVSVSYLFFSHTFNATLKITAQTATSITGTIDFAGIKGTGTFTGSIAANGKFTYTLKSSAGTITLTGHESTDGTRLAGAVTAKGQGLSISGSFEFKRTA